MPYCRNAYVFVCPENPWGFTYSATLSKKPLGQIERPAETVIFFEVGHVEPNMAADPAQAQLAHRHNDGDNFGYVDGHVKWLAGQ
jgi:prepilin-type processing-associated H-X9-DG protein